jgi:oligopeptide/dipeptide ABC transporter ATP-binding protein
MVETTEETTQQQSDGAQDPLIRVRGLKKHFPVKSGILNRVTGQVQAVDGVTLDIYPNETVGLVGESGCGKTTAGRTMVRLTDATDGEVFYRDQNIFDLSTEEMRRLRRNMQFIFQDPQSSLNPRMTVERIIGEAIEFHDIAHGPDRREMVRDLLERVGLQPDYATRYPHEFSGGQRQRIGIARALALNPDFIVCDEPVSALDVSVQAQVINLLEDLQEEFNLSFLFIAHDLSVVKHISDRVAVMYLGRVAELGPTDALFDDPLHPYTQSLLSAIPDPDPREKKERVVLEGDVPSPIEPPEGCRFHTRCPARFGPCDSVEPRRVEVEEGRFVRCHLYDPEFADQASEANLDSLPNPPCQTGEPTDEPEAANGVLDERDVDDDTDNTDDESEETTS